MLMRCLIGSRIPLSWRDLFLMRAKTWPGDKCLVARSLVNVYGCNWDFTLTFADNIEDLLHLKRYKSVL